MTKRVPTNSYRPLGRRGHRHHPDLGPAGDRRQCALLASVHPGCFELFVHEHIRTVTDLKDKQVGIDDVLGTTPHLYVSIMAAHVVKCFRWARSGIRAPGARARSSWPAAAQGRAPAGLADPQSLHLVHAGAASAIRHEISAPLTLAPGVVGHRLLDPLGA
jgi:hypothetical protein